MRLIHSNRTGNDGEHSGDSPATLDSTLHVASDTDLRTSFPPSQCCDYWMYELQAGLLNLAMYCSVRLTVCR